MATHRVTRPLSEAAIKLLKEIKAIDDTIHRPVFRMGRSRLLFRSLSEQKYIEPTSHSGNFGDGYVITEAGKRFLLIKEQTTTEAGMEYGRGQRATAEA